MRIDFRLSIRVYIPMIFLVVSSRGSAVSDLMQLFRGIVRKNNSSYNACAVFFVNVKNTSMRKILFTTRLFLAMILMVMLGGCLKDSVTRTYSIMRPVYKSRAEALAEIKSGPPQPLKTPGKIFLRGNYLFINEVDKGVHVFDNSDPSSLRGVAFIAIPGNVDIGLKDHILYADMYRDLTAVDIFDPLQVKLVKAVRDVFAPRDFGIGITDIGNDDMIISGWVMKDTTVPVGAETDNWTCPNCITLHSDFAGARVGSPAPGIAGSMARFSIVNDYLYAIQSSTVGVYHVADPLNIEAMGAPWAGLGIETVYPFKNKLFIGSQTGMFIYNLNNPAAPQKEGSFFHASACDPVIADDAFAFVTLRTGNFCAGVNNELNVINIENISLPQLVKTYPMTNPHGLAKDGDLLFICDGKDGLKIYNASNPNDLRLIKHLTGMEAYDAIAWNKRLILSATNGIYQYDYSDPQRIRLLSTIAVSK